MSQNSQNLVSKLTWDTRFDSKAQGVALQERLSDWSSYHLQQELAAVFDKFCPPEQTWKIQSLELDLGTINFDQLESELPVKIRQQLNEKLLDLILYSHQRGRYIEIFDGKKTQVELIRHFLFHGMLPWNYQAADGSVNQMLTAQLQKNREELLDMLKESGFSSEQVRRRMAWQFTEPNMVRIIEAFEPNVGGQIILFSNELTKIQQKETVVQAASTADFKKNVWFWVLNYLLTERGTVFNRVQFMKSSIAQMAAHYNMQYEQLFELIEQAVAKLSRSLSLQPDFIVTLQLLSRENKDRQKNKIAQTGNETDYWQLLETFFRDQQGRHTAGKSMAFNELVTAMVKENPGRFKTLIGTFGNSSAFWLPLINDLTTDSLKNIFFAFKYHRQVILIESILFLNRLTGSVKQAERNQLWFKGLMLILGQNSSSLAETDFLRVIVSVLAQQKQLSNMLLLDQLLVAEVPGSMKTLRHTALYRTLTAVFMLEIAQMPVLQFKKHLEKLILGCYVQFKDGIKDRKGFETLKNILENYARFQPKALKEALSASPYFQSLDLMLPVSLRAKKLVAVKQPLGIAWRNQTETPAETGFLEAENWFESLLQQPEELLEFLKKEIVTEAQWRWFQKTISFGGLLATIGRQEKAQQPILDVLQQFYRVLGIMVINGITGGEMQHILFKKVARAWISGNWKLLAAENIWNELIWEICGKRGISKTLFINRVEAHHTALPPLLQLAFTSLLAQYRSQAKQHNNKVDPQTKPNQVLKPIIMTENKAILKGGINVKNAGLVILSGYLPVLLERLRLVEDHKFINAESQLDAVHYLQYVVTGLSHTDEAFLALNKVLCGLALQQPVKDGVDVSEQDSSLIEGMIKAVVNYWSTIGQSSVNGFRGNWLVRDGLLTEKEDRWELTVEKRSYDLLLNRSPFSFSIIKYPWMAKPLHVNWAY